MQKLKVAIVAPSIRAPGGQAVQAARLLEAWQGDPEIDARLVSVNPEPPHILEPIERIRYLRQLVALNMFLPRLVAQVATADVVHVFGAAYRAFLLAPLPALICARTRAVPVVLNYHNGEAPDHLERSALARIAIRRVNRVVVPSRYLVAVFAQFGVRAIPIANTIDLSRFQFRERSGIRPRLISTRNFHPLYNVACTLRSFRVIQDRWPDATLTLAGDGPGRPMLERLSRLLDLRGVRFLGRVNQSSMPALYAEHDVYIQSPDVDNDPNSIVEAFATGLPVVSTGVGGISTMLTDGDQGLLASRNDHGALAAQVLRVLADPGLAHHLIQGGRQACERYRWTAVRTEWLRLYGELAAAKPSPAAQPTGADLSFDGIPLPLPSTTHGVTVPREQNFSYTAPP